MKNFIITVITILTATIVSAQKYNGEKSTTSPEEKLNELYCTGLFKTTHGTILDIENNMSVRSYINILDWLPGRVAGLQVYQSRSGVSIPVIRGSVPGIYVDEMPVPLSYLQALSVADIAIIKIIKTAFYGGFNAGNGAIAIYTLGSEEEEDVTDSK